VCGSICGAIAHETGKLSIPTEVSGLGDPPKLDGIAALKLPTFTSGDLTPKKTANPADALVKPPDGAPKKKASNGDPAPLHWAKDSPCASEASQQDTCTPGGVRRYGGVFARQYGARAQKRH
jgi:hypothetical protein